VAIQAKEILRMRETLNDIFAFHTHQDIEKIRKDTDRDFFMSGEEAKEYGIVDHVITQREVEPTSKDKKKKK
jgi:ATP-dependent Clp protease protease subunit